VFESVRSLRKEEKRLLHLVGEAVRDFSLISEGDRIALALSGGKDSFSMVRLLYLLRDRAPVRFELFPLTVHSGAAGFRGADLGDYLRARDVPHHLETTEIVSILRKKRRENSSACSFCARLRRGALYGAALRLGCNKVALGHHLDDLAETLLMNLFFSGSLKSMPPKLKAENGKIVLIRPMVYVPEELLRVYAEGAGFPVIDCGCALCEGMDGQRARMKQLVRIVADGYPEARQSLRKALANVLPRYLLDTSLHEFDLEEV